MCSIHGMQNNRFGFCPGCEEDPRIQIVNCERCGNPFAVSMTQSAELCQKCAIEEL